MGRMAIKEEFRVPLDGQKEALGGGFDRFDNSVRSHGARDQRWRHSLDGLMMGTVHHQGCPADNLPQEALWRNRHGMGRLSRFRLLTVVQDMPHLRRNVLKKAAAARDVDRLHPSTNPQERKITISRLMDQIKLKIGAPFTHERETVLLSLTIEAGWKIRAAPGNEKAIDAVEKPPPGSRRGNEGQDEWDTAKFFDRSNISSPQKIGWLLPPHILPVTGIEVRRHADDRFHITEPGCSLDQMKQPLPHPQQEHQGNVWGGHL